MGPKWSKMVRGINSDLIALNIHSTYLTNTSANVPKFGLSLNMTIVDLFVYYTSGTIKMLCMSNDNFSLFAKNKSRLIYKYFFVNLSSFLFSNEFSIQSRIHWHENKFYFETILRDKTNLSRICFYTFWFLCISSLFITLKFIKVHVVLRCLLLDIWFFFQNGIFRQFFLTFCWPFHVFFIFIETFIIRSAVFLQLIE